MMIANPPSLQDWKNSCDADAAEKIFRLLMPFYERPLELQPVMDEKMLLTKIAIGLDGIGFPTDKVRIVSVGSVMRPLEWLSENDRNLVRSMLCSAVAATTDHALGTVMLEMSPLLVTKGVRYVEGLHNVQDIYTENLKRMSVGGRFTKLVASNLFKCLHFQIGFLATHDQAGAAKMAPFTEMYVNGHFGLGMTIDRTFIVVTG